MLASSTVSLSSPLGGFLWGVIIPLPTYPLSAIHPEGSIPSSSPEESRAATSCMDLGQGSEARTGRPSGRTRIRALMPVALCSPRPQFAVIPPAPAGEEGAVHHVVAALGRLLGREQQPLQDPGKSLRQGLDGPRDRGPAHAQLLSDHRLRNVVAQVDLESPAATRTGPGSAGGPRPPPRAAGRADRRTRHRSIPWYTP